MSLHVGEQHAADRRIRLADFLEQLRRGQPLLVQGLGHGRLEDRVYRLQGAHQVSQYAQFRIRYLEYAQALGSFLFRPRPGTVRNWHLKKRDPPGRKIAGDCCGRLFYR